MAVTHLTTAMASNRGTDFVNANGGVTGTNITGTIYSNGLSLSVAAPGAGGGAALQGSGTYSQNTGTVQFANSNGVTFGLSNNGAMTASVETNYQAPGAYLTTAMLSNAGSNFVGLNSAITANGVSMTNNSSGLSLNFPAFLTTAMQSASSSVFAKTGFTTATTVGSELVGTHDTNGLSLGVPKWLTVAAGAGDGYNIVGVNGNTVGSANTIQFSNSNNVTFGLNGSTITASASYVNDLTSGRAGVGETVGTIAGTDLAMTVDTNGVSVGYPKWITTYAAQSNQPVAASGSNGSFNFSTLQFVTGNGASFYTDATGMRLSYTVPSATVFSNSNNVTFGLNGSTVTASASVAASAALDHSHGNPTLALTNLTGTTASASNGFTLSLSAAAPGAGAAVTASASNGSFTVGQLGFSNANNVTFGTSAGSIITASVAAPGAAAENNWLNALGANVAGNTTASGSTIGLSGINMTISGTNDSVMNLSVPATSSISAVNGFYISANASTISMGQNVLQFFEPAEFRQANSTTFAPGIGSWYIQPINVQQPIASGRINFLVSHGSTSNLLNLSNGANFASNTTGGASYSFNHSYMAALYSRGAGANSTRWDSIWSNTWGMSISRSLGISVTNASQITLSHQHTMNYVSQVGTDGAYTMGGTGMSHSASSAGSTGATSGFITGMASLQNMISGAMLIPMGFNTSLSPGNYLLGLAYSTASTTGGTSINGASIWPLVNMVAMYKMASYSHRQFASTASSTGSQYFMPQGVFSAASASAPATINPRDVRSQASNQQPYVNFMQSNFN